MAANSSACDDAISICFFFPDFAEMTYIVDLLCMHIIAHPSRRYQVLRLSRASLDGLFLRFRHCLELDDFVFAGINVSCSVALVGRDVEMGKAQVSV
jgi:hypothetical protein